MQQVIRIDLKIRKGTENPILFRFSVPFRLHKPVSLYEFGAWESFDFRILPYTIRSPGKGECYEI